MLARQKGLEIFNVYSVAQNAYRQVCSPDMISALSLPLWASFLPSWGSFSTARLLRSHLLFAALAAENAQGL